MIGKTISLIAVVSLVMGCQSYAFEELPSSVIKEKRWTQTISISSAADILFVVDNSGSMVGEQRQLAESFRQFAQKLGEKFGNQYHIGVITTGMESPGCPPCTDLVVGSCMNETGEMGRFQDRLGKNRGTVDIPDYVFRTDATCRVVTADNTQCFYDEGNAEGIALVGINGCGYERGLAPLRLALEDLAGSYNAGFLRDNATLAVVVISDEDDCGRVGDVSEGVPGAMGNMCYFASKGIGPDGETTHPNDTNQREYKLEDVENYHDFLLGVKNNREGMVKFAAIVGIKDVEDLSTTTIEYQWNQAKDMYDIVDACNTGHLGCSGSYCFAEPGTRYLKLAQMFGIGQNGFVDTICQTSFSETMEKLGTFVACPESFLLSEPIRDPDLANILINGDTVPRYSCQIPGRLEACTGPGSTCSQGECVETWSYTPPSTPPDPNALGGTIEFADHYEPCELFGEGEQVHIELVYVTE